MSFLYDECSLCELKEKTDLEGFCCGDKDLDDFFTNDCFAYAKELLGKLISIQLSLHRQQLSVLSLLRMQAYSSQYKFY